MDSSEQELIRRAQTGDREAFDALVGRTYPLVFHTAYRLLGDRELAADATQWAFVRAYRALSSFRQSASFSTWLYRIVVNVCTDLARQQYREGERLWRGEAEDPEDEQERPLPDEREAPERIAVSREQQRVVHEALQRLSFEHRVVIVLYDLAGFSYEEIARMLGAPLGTIKSRLNRARLALRTELERYRELLE